MKNAINPNFQQMDECDLYDSFTTEYLQSIITFTFSAVKYLNSLSLDAVLY